MSGARYDELVEQLLESELDEAGARELAALVRGRPDLRRDLRHHLELWELWSQTQAPERSADAFLAGFRTRLRAEGESESFLASVKQRLSGETEARPDRPPAPFGRWHSLLVQLRRPANLAWAACATVALLGALVWLLPTGTAQAMSTLQGEVVCRACILGETHEHLPAIRVVDADGTHIYQFKSDRAILREVGNYCARPIPVTAQGNTSWTDGHLELRVHSCTKRPPAAAPPPTPAQPVTTPPSDGPVLFPF